MNGKAVRDGIQLTSKSFNIKAGNMSQEEFIHILHVDDNENDLYIFKHKLNEMDPTLSIEWAKSAEEALKKLDEGKFDCLLADHEMPGGMNGLKLLETLKKKGINVPFIYLTGQGNEQIAAEAFRLGACDYYSKNFGFAYFHRIVNSIKQNVRSYRKALEQTKAEEIMKQLNKERERILSNMNEIIWSMEIDQSASKPARYTYISPAIEKVTGFSTKEFLNNPGFLKSRVHPDDIYGFSKAQAEIMMGKPSSIECRFKRKDEKYFWTKAIIFPEIDETGKIHRIQGITSDINAQKEAEFSRQASEQKYHTLFNMAPFIITITSLKDGKILEVNDTMLTTTGYTRAELIGKSTLDLNLWVDPSDRKRMVDDVRKMGFTRGLKTRIQLKNGQTIDVTLDALHLTFEGEDCMMMLVRTAHVSEEAYDEFQQSENRYRFVFSNTIDPILVFDDTGKVLDANHSAARLLGWGRFDLLESSIDKLIDGNTANQLDKIIKAQDDENLVIGFKRKNGEIFRAGIRSSVFQAEGVSYIQVMVDQADTAGDFISFRQRINRYLDALKTAHDSFFRENPEEEAGKILEAIGEAALASAVIWISSTKGKKSKSGFEEKSRWNSTKEGKSDFSAEEIFTGLFSPSMPQWAENIAKGTIISSFVSTCSSEERRLLKDTGLGGFAAAPIMSDRHEGFIVLAWKNQKTSLIPYETIFIKSIVDGFGNALDAKKKEDGFDISERMLEGFFKISPDIIYVRTESGLFKTVNERFASLLDMEPEKIIDKPLKDVLPSNICERFEQNSKKVIETDAPAQFIINLNEHSVERVFHIMEFPFYKSSGGETMLAGAGREITDFFTQDDKVRRINAELDEFVHKVSHDLKAPIRNVIAYIEMAEDKGPEGKEYLKKAMNQCTKLQVFIGKLLELSKAGRTVGNFHNFDSNLLVVEVFDLFRNQYSGIELKIAEELPEVFADRTSIMEVFQNLILNALENSDKSKPAPYIKVSSNVANKEIVFIVEDNGIGINKLYLDKIQSSSYNLYEKELQLHGFGLSISRRIIEAHGGRLWAESTEKEGSRFYFSIPSISNENSH